MEQFTQATGDQPTVKQMFATLLGEITTLRRQNEHQQRQLEHLRSTTSLLLERDSTSPQTSGKLQFKHLPTEIREMIWELAMPIRLLGFKGIEPKTGVPSTLSIPAAAHVCQESRRVFAGRKQYATDRGSDLPTKLWRLKENQQARWSSFVPHTDVLLINPHDFLRKDWETNYPLASVAEHIVVESLTSWGQFIEFGFEHGDEQIITKWIGGLAMFPDYSPSLERDMWRQPPLPTRAPICHLRTVDFAIHKVTKVDQNYPPNLIHRLFAGDRVRIVDLRDREAVDKIEKIIRGELSPIMEWDGNEPWPAHLRDSLETFKAAATTIFPSVKKAVLTNLVRAYYNASIHHADSRRSWAHLPSPFRDGKCDMEVIWVKELCKRIDVRPVHVFVRADGISNLDW